MHTMHARMPTSALRTPCGRPAGALRAPCGVRHAVAAPRGRRAAGSKVAAAQPTQPAATTGRGAQQPRSSGGGSRPLPEPAAHQQTLRRSFALGGIGLHTGEYAHVRVAPAFAGEGRYFVRVPPGTVSPSWEAEQPQPRRLEDVHGGRGMDTAADEELGAQLFFSFIEGQERGSFAGTFADYLQQRAGVQPDSLLVDAEAELLPEQEPATGRPHEIRLPAHARSLQQGHQWCSVLGEGADAVWGAEHLLAALECCGVDNARIEVEGGREIPIVDGSALGWAAEVQRAGLRAAPPAAGADGPAERGCPTLQELVTVRDGESFITFYPGESSCVTVGVDCTLHAPVIGRQWFTWSPEDLARDQGSHFRRALAPARTTFASAEAVRALLDEGMLQGGPDYVSIIGNGDDWLDATMVRFPRDEAARHAVVDLLGDLSLLATPGGRGLPVGHVVAYQPTHALQAAFVLKVLQAGTGAPTQAPGP